ncbi:TIM21-domain-containing protein [Venturia nashicola]|nr:TIM21-domain-containing protein [Venturia nashicola]
MATFLRSSLIHSNRRQANSLLRAYATSSSSNPPPKSSNHTRITTFNDDGRVNWNRLSTREKAARSTQQSFNLLVIIAGVLMTGAVSYIMYTEVFSLDSKTSQFNYAVSKIRDSRECVSLLCGPGGRAKDIKAYGEGSNWNRWDRNRVIAGSSSVDRAGNENWHIHFNVEGPVGRGVVRVHLIRPKERGEWEYKVLALDVPGHERVWLENMGWKFGVDKKSGTMFGIKWW